MALGTGAVQYRGRHRAVERHEAAGAVSHHGMYPWRMAGGHHSAGGQADGAHPVTRTVPPTPANPATPPGRPADGRIVAPPRPDWTGPPLGRAPLGNRPVASR